MGKIVPRLKREIVSAIPAVAFFFVVFQLLALTRALILSQYGIEVSTFLNATLGALIIGKVILTVDLLPFINRFPDKPLIYNTVWKTSIYMIAAMIVRYAEHLVPRIFEYKSLSVANSHLLDEVVWAHFWLVQLWLLVCLLVYCTVREIGRTLGREQVRAMFFGPRSDVV